MDTTNKSILLTGASGGIGREIALAFARSGGKLVLAGRNKDALEDVRASVEQAGGQAIVVPGDVTNAEWRKEGGAKSHRNLWQPGYSGEQCRGGVCG